MSFNKKRRASGEGEPWPAPGRHDATAIADRYNQETSAAVEQSVSSGRGRPKLVGLLANEEPAGDVYARVTKRACDKVGIEYELRRPARLDLEDGVISANADPSVHGLIVYYPVFGGGKDGYLRDVISDTKDVEGLSHRYCYALYHNIRYIEEGTKKKCVLPCTPLACIKVLENLGAYNLQRPVGKQLSGRKAIIYNRSEVVGRPLAAMLANDGATVYSVDEHGMLIYTKGAVEGAIKVEETELAVAEALAASDIVIGGVPVKSFKLSADSLKPGAICINVSQHMNFGEGVEAKCALVPAMGKVTIAILSRNLLRLYDNFHAPSAPNAPAASTRVKLATSPSRVAALLISSLAAGFFLGRLTAPK